MLTSHTILQEETPGNLHFNSAHQGLSVDIHSIQVPNKLGGGCTPVLTNLPFLVLPDKYVNVLYKELLTVPASSGMISTLHTSTPRKMP